jgi:hypothetical protein
MKVFATRCYSPACEGWEARPYFFVGSFFGSTYVVLVGP